MFSNNASGKSFPSLVLLNILTSQFMSKSYKSNSTSSERLINAHENSALNFPQPLMSFT